MILLRYPVQTLKKTKSHKLISTGKTSNGKDSLYAYVIETDPFMVQFGAVWSTSRSDAFRLNDLKFEVLFEDFV